MTVAMVTLWGEGSGSSLSSSSEDDDDGDEAQESDPSECVGGMKKRRQREKKKQRWQRERERESLAAEGGRGGGRGGGRWRDDGESSEEELRLSSLCADLRLREREGGCERLALTAHNPASQSERRTHTHGRYGNCILAVSIK